MESFELIEREVFAEVEKLDTNINIVTDASEIGQNVLAKLTEELQLNEPVTVTVTIDDSGSVTYRSSNPIAKHLMALAENATSESALNDQIVDYQCRSLVSFPERLANKFAKCKNAFFTFNTDLFLERLSDAIFLFYFTKPQHVQQSSEALPPSAEIHQVLSTLVLLLVRRGNMAVLARRLFLLPRDLFQSAHFRSEFSKFYFSIFSACKIQRFSLKSTKNIAISQTWDQWNAFFFSCLEKRIDIKNELVLAISSVINDFSTDDTKALGRALFESVFTSTFFIVNVTRNSIRTVFKDLLEMVAGPSPADELLTAREQTCFASVFRIWDDKDFVTSGVLREVLAVLHPVMYALLYMRKKYPNSESFPQKYVGALLNGVSLRLDSTRGDELRASAMTVAAAFATLFVNDADGAASLTQDPNFARALESWMKEEQNSENSIIAAKNGKRATSTTKPEKRTLFSRRAIVLSDAYPLDPEERYTFFVTPEQRKHNEMVVKPSHGVALATLSDAVLPSALPAFGQQKYAKDELGDHVSILSSIRECYNAIIGVGRGPNAQLHEVQEAAESGLRGLSDAFAKLRDRIDSDLFRAVSKESGPLIPTLLPALISLNVHAPDEEKQSLLQLRYDALVNLILLNPLQSLNQLSGMLYRSNYGVYQRNELIKAIGEAAFTLSQVEIHKDLSDVAKQKNEELADRKTKRIYPPIPTHQLSADQKTAIVVTEGQRTRRWGSANIERARRRGVAKHYSNFLGQFAAAFIAAFLYKLDADHFGFFQSSDPYTPCAILDALTIVFQGITNVRHIAPDLCEKNFDFFFTVCTRHPNLTVKKAGWTTIVEVMRTWCGVGPLWIRQKDGQRVLNRDAGANGSLVFTTSWLNALELLQSTCEKLLHSNDGCGRTALIAVSSLRDLVYDRDAVQAMQSHSSHAPMTV